MRGGLSDPNTMKKEDEFKASFMLLEAALDGDKQAVIRGIVFLQVRTKSYEGVKFGLKK